MKKYIFTEYPNSVGESSIGHGSIVICAAVCQQEAQGGGQQLRRLSAHKLPPAA